MFHRYVCSHPADGGYLHLWHHHTHCPWLWCVRQTQPAERIHSQGAKRQLHQRMKLPALVYLCWVKDRLQLVCEGCSQHGGSHVAVTDLPSHFHLAFAVAPLIRRRSITCRSAWTRLRGRYVTWKRRVKSLSRRWRRRALTSSRSGRRNPGSSLATSCRCLVLKELWWGCWIYVFNYTGRLRTRPCIFTWNMLEWETQMKTQYMSGMIYITGGHL